MNKGDKQRHSSGGSFVHGVEEMAGDAWAKEGEDSGSEDVALELPAEVSEWDQIDLSRWLEQEGFKSCIDKFARHRIDGSLLFELDSEDLWQIGIKRVGVRTKLADAITVLQQKKVRHRANGLVEPNYTEAFFQLFTFSWAQTSEGKAGNECKDEISQTSLAISVVSSLLTSICFDWFITASSDCFCLRGGTIDDCYCSTGYDLDATPLSSFYLCSGSAALLFLCATVVCVLQVIAVNEMSDEAEITLFVDMMNHETLQGKLVSLGLLFMLGGMYIYTFFTQRLGVFADDARYTSSLMVVINCAALFYAIVYSCSLMVKNVYRTKLVVSKRHAEEEARKQEQRTAMRRRLRQHALLEHGPEMGAPIVS